VIEPVPPFTGTALNNTEVPAQILPDGEALMLTDTGKAGFTLRVTVFEVAGLPVAQAREDVRTA
jgi:hypothetical protein